MPTQYGEGKTEGSDLGYIRNSKLAGLQDPTLIFLFPRQGFSVTALGVLELFID